MLWSTRVEIHVTSLLGNLSSSVLLNNSNRSTSNKETPTNDWKQAGATIAITAAETETVAATSQQPPQ